MRALLLLLICSLAVGLSGSALRSKYPSRDRDYSPLYLPHTKHVRLVTLGFDRFAADLIWFRTMSYFGKQVRRKEGVEWLRQMCTLVSELNPKALHVYEFCGTLLSWVAKDPAGSNELLTRAISFFPNVWRLPYIRGFNSWYFLDNRAGAKEDFLRASRIPGAPPFLASLASRLLTADEDPDTALVYLKDLIENTPSDSARAALSERYKLAIISKNIRSLEEKAAQFRATRTEELVDLQQLLDAGIVQSIPGDPFGGRYIIENGSVISTTRGRGLVFGGRNAKTGLARGEFDDTKVPMPEPSP